MALADNLISYWSLEEASGTRADAHGTNDLTDNNTVAGATGKVGTAADFEADNSEYLSRADNADLSTGDIDYTVAAWVYLESKGASRSFVSKENEFALWYDSGGDSLAFSTVNAGGSSAQAQTGGSPSTATWYYVVGVHDSVNNLTKISVNGGAFATQSFSAGSSDTGNPFYVGRFDFFGAKYMDGLIDEVGFWKRCLTADEVTELYNGGSGRDYAYVTGGSPPPPAAVTGVDYLTNDVAYRRAPRPSVAA